MKIDGFILEYVGGTPKLGGLICVFGEAIGPVCGLSVAINTENVTNCVLVA